MIKLNNEVSKKKKKSMRGTITSTTHSLGIDIGTRSRNSNSLIDDDMLVFEILTRLPVKTLFRFKSVCKQWCSLIRQDQQFIDLHLTRSKTRPTTRMLIFVPVPMSKEEIGRDEPLTNIGFWPYQEFYIMADLMSVEDDNNDKNTTKVVVDTPRLIGSPSYHMISTRVVVNTPRLIDSYSYNMISKPVNGLICLIDLHIGYVFRLCNISTGEVSPRFESKLFDKHGIPYYKEKYRDRSVNCGFGFDPVTNEHKLVRVWNMEFSRLNPNTFPICEVVTIGGHQGIDGNIRWRKIEEVPPYELTNESVCVNGVIYWTTKHLMKWQSGSNTHPVCIVAFDVGSEKFRAIRLPDFILDHPRTFKLYIRPEDGRVDLLEVDGCVAVVIRMKNDVFKMYTYENDYKKEEINITSTTSCNKMWKKVSSFTLPFDLGNNLTIKFRTFVGSDDKIILTSIDRQECHERKKKCVSIYCYNWKKDSWTEFDVSGIPSSIRHLCHGTIVTTFCESLLPLNNLNTTSP